MARAFVEVYGDEIVATELFDIGDRAGDLTPLWPEIFRRLEVIEKEQFATEGARSGDHWHEQARTTLLRKFRKGQSLELMKATEALYLSLTGETIASVRTSGTDWAMFGSTLTQFNVQQDRNPSSNFPERLPINLTEVDAFEMAEIMLGYIMGTHGKHGIRLPARGAGGRFVAS